MMAKIKTYGLCFGVKNAYNKALKLSKEGKSLFFSTPLAHNEFLTKEIDRLNKQNDGPMIEVISTHGGETKNDNFLDLTCPFLLSLYDKIKAYQDAGDQILIIGDRAHQEVKAIASHFPAAQIYTLELIFDPALKYKVFNQSTILNDKLEQIINEIKSRMPSELDIEFVNSTCPIITSRLEKILTSDKNKTLLFFSSLLSSNGKQQFAFLKSFFKKAYFITNSDDLQNISFDRQNIIVASSTSTSDEEINLLLKPYNVILDED
jgi:4-hydroxy-3-methylbut-2-enyl diphosphate reductase